MAEALQYTSFRGEVAAFFSSQKEHFLLDSPFFHEFPKNNRNSHGVSGQRFFGRPCHSPSYGLHHLDRLSLYSSCIQLHSAQSRGHVVPIL